MDEDAVRARRNTGELCVDQGEGLEALEAARVHGKELLYDYNHTRPGETEERLRPLGELLGAVGESIWIEPPFLAAYGSHVNHSVPVHVEDDVWIGGNAVVMPGVTIGAGSVVGAGQRRDEGHPESGRRGRRSVPRRAAHRPGRSRVQIPPPGSGAMPVVVANRGTEAALGVAAARSTARRGERGAWNAWISRHTGDVGALAPSQIEHSRLTPARCRSRA
jgi:galactoside O-acetyltransferase